MCVHDAYVAGTGILHPALLGLVSLTQLRGEGALAEGELMRYLAEVTWYPTALLPSQGVRWQAVDEHSAKAQLSDGNTQITLTFVFNDNGSIDRVHSASRRRSGPKRSTAVSRLSRWP